MKRKRKHSRKGIKTLHRTVLTAMLMIIPVLLCIGFFIRKINNDYVFEIIRKIETQRFKYMLNYTMPIIDICYNSGMASISFTGEIQNIFEGLYGINIMNPKTILNSQFALLGGYDCIKRSGAETPPPKSETEDKQPQPEYKKNQSSISTDDEYEKQPEQPGQQGQLEQPEKSQDLKQDGKAEIRNETNFSIDVDVLSSEQLNFKLSPKGPSVLIFHTHTTESYSKVYKFLEGDEPGWDMNPKNNVVRVGAELSEKLKKTYGIDVIHNGTIHDHPSYSGSYNKSLNTVQSILKSYPSIKIVIDIHRDGLSENKQLRTVKNINGVNVAQVMFVVGTNQSGLYHPNWKQNLKLAIYLQNKLNSWCPGLARPINLRAGRFNQHVSAGALLIEVGGDGNTLEEAIASTAFLARAIGSIK